MAAKRRNRRRQQELPQNEVASEGPSQGRSEPDSGPPPPDMTLGLWVSWLEQNFGAARDWIGSDKPWWQVTADELAGKILAGGVKQLDDILAKDPILHAIDQMWNANPLRDVVPIDWGEITRALRTVWLHSLRKPEKAIAAVAELNLTLWRSALDTWTEASQRWWGLAGADSPQGSVPPPSDKRFAAPEWLNNPIYRTLKELYLLASDWLLKQGDIEGMDEAERQRLNFHLRQFVDAMSPALLLVSNPAALRRAMETGGASLAEGARNLLNDLKEGRLSIVDLTAFAPGRNLALTPGKVVHRNRLMELIQYAPTTATVHETPLLIVPHWINKYYILDMQPKNSMVRYLVEQGFTVFIISWKNPDKSMASLTIEDYMDLGPLEASEVVREITGKSSMNVMGYCIGGTLLALTLAWLSARRDRRFASATYMVSLQDFAKVGDTAVFISEPSIDLIERQMLERGYLDSRELANVFNLLRANDLIWANVVNNYLLGNKPPAFDLLYWNSDGTRMAAAAHNWYLRNTYLENNLIKPGKIHLKGEAIDLGRITLDSYAVGAEKDHIVPWDAAWRITQLVAGTVRFVLASSGHIAGIVNPPGGKGAYWVAEPGTRAVDPQQWFQAATRHEGSWWKDWAAWLSQRSGRRVDPPPCGTDTHPPLADAPGSYVLEK
ncbi:MAG TPA: class I poly(R)-hydroxyalkanoic acid synthase [Isosphaeraceae bacterium]|nr:class I poly(R)-hydroxyalkanoic acid synthase [Isosphaeraceae bacterium]